MAVVTAYEYMVHQQKSREVSKYQTFKAAACSSFVISESSGGSARDSKFHHSCSATTGANVQEQKPLTHDSLSTSPLIDCRRCPLQSEKKRLRLEEKIDTVTNLLSVNKKSSFCSLPDFEMMTSISSRESHTHGLGIMSSTSSTANSLIVSDESLNLSFAKIVLQCHLDSKPFNERTVDLLVNRRVPIQDRTLTTSPTSVLHVGRTVAPRGSGNGANSSAPINSINKNPQSSAASNSNSMLLNPNVRFDSNVLSRNHAILWYESETGIRESTHNDVSVEPIAMRGVGGAFYVKDTKSANGTFINSRKLSEKSPPLRIVSGDVIQFGVDVMEHAKKVVHGCIIARLKLYHPDGSEAILTSGTTVASPMCALPSSICVPPSSSKLESPPSAFIDSILSSSYFVEAGSSSEVRSSISAPSINQSEMNSYFSHKSASVLSTSLVVSASAKKDASINSINSTVFESSKHPSKEIQSNNSQIYSSSPSAIPTASSPPSSAVSYSSENLYCQLKWQLTHATELNATLSCKIVKLASLLHSNREMSGKTWRASINEERLVARISALQSRLLVYARSLKRLSTSSSSSSIKGEGRRTSVARKLAQTRKVSGVVRDTKECVESATESTQYEGHSVGAKIICQSTSTDLEKVIRSLAETQAKLMCSEDAISDVKDELHEAMERRLHAEVIAKKFECERNSMKEELDFVNRKQKELYSDNKKLLSQISQLMHTVSALHGSKKSTDVGLCNDFQNLVKSSSTDQSIQTEDVNIENETDSRLHVIDAHSQTYKTSTTEEESEMLSNLENRISSISKLESECEKLEKSREEWERKYHETRGQVLKLRDQSEALSMCSLGPIMLITLVLLISHCPILLNYILNLFFTDT